MASHFECVGARGDTSFPPPHLSSSPDPPPPPLSPCLRCLTDRIVSCSDGTQLAAALASGEPALYFGPSGDGGVEVTVEQMDFSHW